ncbi:MAG: FAD-dependent oxidoreductase [Aliarcobacter sp.]|nr:FAD-dependent oxidoreductase [Aliarcobacter sp.]
MQLPHEKYDIVIIGGGAVGSGIVLDATLRGYKVILLEKDDFASGASSKSSKLVHGGVRYLEKAIKNFDKAQYDLVKEGLQERAIFLKNASNISSKIKINIPVFSYINLFYTWIGLFIYRLIARKKSLGNNSFLNKVVSSLFFPNIKNERLKGCISFFDGSFLDIRMIISLLQTASTKGADFKNYCEVKGFLYDENQKIIGVKYFDKFENKDYEIFSKCVINSSGANIDNIRSLDDKNSDEILALSSGIHIVVKKEFLGSTEALLISNTSDGRIIFILPYLNHCLIGTTDNSCVYEENPKVKDEEIEYLLNEVNIYFQKTLKKEDILSSWSGIRPLIKTNNKNSTQEIVREHLITNSKNGLISIAGGKWTTYRKMAEDLMDFLIDKKYLNKKEPCITKNFKLVGNEEKNKDLEKLISFYPISKNTKESLITLYGTNATKILSLANELGNFELINENLPYLKAEIIYCIENEFVKKPIDFLARRVGVCFVHKEASLSCVDVVCQEMTKLYNWDEKETKFQINETKEYIHKNF